MGQRTLHWKRKRYLADVRSLVVHDCWTGGCTEDELLTIVRRGDAIGFEPDVLLSALESLFHCCPHCVSWDDLSEAMQGWDEPPPPPNPAPLLPRGPLLRAGSAESMEDLASEDDVQAA